MFHMLSCFNLKPGQSLDDFSSALESYAGHMIELGLLHSVGPVGVRQRDTILDTDDDRPQGFYMLMHFEDKAQSDRAVDYIESANPVADRLHRQLYGKAQDMVFTCWEDASSQ